jgi:hypothetical protein
MTEPSELARTEAARLVNEQTPWPNLTHEERARVIEATAAEMDRAWALAVTSTPEERAALELQIRRTAARHPSTPPPAREERPSERAMRQLAAARRRTPVWDPDAEAAKLADADQARRDRQAAIAKALDTALRIARSAPDKPHPHTFATLIPWSLLQQLRADLDAAGIPWRTAGMVGRRD